MKKYICIILFIIFILSGCAENNYDKNLIYKFNNGSLIFDDSNNIVYIRVNFSGSRCIYTPYYDNTGNYCRYDIGNNTIIDSNNKKIEVSNLQFIEIINKPINYNFDNNLVYDSITNIVYMNQPINNFSSVYQIYIADNNKPYKYDLENNKLVKIE
jgi:hypothetical protein